MSYLQKYEKYKKKYLKLKYKQTGGGWNCPACTFENHDEVPICELCHTQKPLVQKPLVQKPKFKTFYVYTTGILDGNVGLSWNNVLRSTILRNIDKSFDQVIIRHYDPGEIRYEIGKYIIEEDHKYTNLHRNIQSQFINGTIDFSQIDEPHLLLDAAHVLHYYPNKLTHYVPYDEPIEEKDQKKYNTINSVYTGYCHTISFEDPRSFPHFIASQNFFKMDINGIVETYIDRFFKFNNQEKITERQNQLITEDPPQIIEIIYDIIIKRAYIYCKEKSKKIFYDLITIELKEEISHQIINYIMTTDDYNFDNLINTIYITLIENEVNMRCFK